MNVLDPSAYDAVRRPLLEAETLPPECYTSETFFRREIETIFMKVWNFIGRTEDIPNPGDYYTVDFAGVPLIIVRDDPGQVRGFVNSCRHRGAKVVTGKGSARALKVTLEADGEPWVEGDAFLLRRAVSNLLDNALDFSPQGGTVAVRLAGQRRSVDITVSDQGPGVPEYADEKVFEKFYSLARPHSNKKSTGLGLPFVKEIAELHEGRVSLRNGEGGGAVATLSLPRAEPGPAGA